MTTWETLLQLLPEGWEEACFASMLQIADLSDVALLERLGASKEWFEWIVCHLYDHKTVSYPKPEVLSNYRILAVDGSTIMEKGAVPKEWHLHDALDIFTLATVEARVTDGKTGESLKNYSLKANDLVLGDRAYGTKASMLIEMGFDPLEIADCLGHESVKATLDTYSHLYPDKDQKLAGALNKLSPKNYE